MTDSEYAILWDREREWLAQVQALTGGSPAPVLEQPYGDGCTQRESQP